jgi:hypothetical protein
VAEKIDEGIRQRQQELEQRVGQRKATLQMEQQRRDEIAHEKQGLERQVEDAVR